MDAIPSFKLRYPAILNWLSHVATFIFSLLIVLLLVTVTELLLTAIAIQIFVQNFGLDY